MRRRSTALTVDGEDVLEWVLESASIVAAGRELGLRQRDVDPRLVLNRDDVAPGPHARLHALRRERRAAGEAWCAERGLSYAMTVQGSPRPTQAETAAGCTRGAGPKYAAAEQRRAEYRR